MENDHYLLRTGQDLTPMPLSLAVLEYRRSRNGKAVAVSRLVMRQLSYTKASIFFSNAYRFFYRIREMVFYPVILFLAC